MKLEQIASKDREQPSVDRLKKWAHNRPRSGVHVDSVLRWSPTKPANLIRLVPAKEELSPLPIGRRGPRARGHLRSSCVVTLVSKEPR